MTQLRTGWTKGFTEAGGLDHLGTQAPCISIYGYLIPGITNVTDRARYYSFYPWLIWAFEEEGISKTRTELISWFRKADCLFTMIGVRHDEVSDPHHHGSNPHRSALIGVNAIGKGVRELTETNSLEIMRYATQDTGQARYFMNSLGGLGQYYKGTLIDLGVLAQTETNFTGVTKDRGVKLAKAFDAAVNRKLFFETLREGTVTASRLDELSCFCPCRLSAATNEQSELMKMFFGSDNDEDSNRRETLGLLLNLISNLSDLGSKTDMQTLRSCFYTGHLPERHPAQLPEKLHNISEKWEIYQRNDLFSYATQTIFFSVLSLLDRFPNDVSGSAQFAGAFVATEEVETIFSKYEEKSVSKIVGRFQKNIPNLEDWAHEEHEMKLAEQIRMTFNKGDHFKSFELGLKLLFTLTARESFNHSYRDLVEPLSNIKRYPLNLATFKLKYESTWAKMNLQEFSAWLIVHWGVETHMKVALRKLSDQSNDTFLVIPSENGLVIPTDKTIPEPVHTNPRLNQAMQILLDIGCLKLNDDGHHVLTELGREKLAEVVDG